MASLATMKEQGKDIDFLLQVGELFTLVAYGQLILENRGIYQVGDDLVDQIFDVMVRDFSRYALAIYGKPIATEEQQRICLRMIRRPVADPARTDRVWNQHVFALKDAYTMNP